MTEIADDALLDAAREQFVRTGVRKTSADDIARRAGVNRVTLYRRLGTKNEIVRRTYLRETERVLAVIEAATGPVPAPGPSDFDPVAYVARFFTVTVTALRENALLAQLLEIDREQTLIGLTLNAGETLTLSAQLVEARVRALRAYVANTAEDDIALLAGTLSRVAQSLALTPDAPPTLGSPQEMDRYARLVIAPMILGR